MINRKLRQKISASPFLHKTAWKIVQIGNDKFFSEWKKKNDVSMFWKELNTRRESDRCFVIGNGPSLTYSDLELIKNEDCFVSNGFYRMYSQMHWRPKYYVLQDRYCLSGKKFNLLEAEYILIGDYCWRSNDFFPDDFFCFHTFRVSDSSEIFFSDNVEKVVVDAYTVTFSIMQMAVYLGYKEIYLLGIDHSYPYVYDDLGNIIQNHEEKAHFYDGEATDAFITNVEGMTKAYICARDYACKHGVKIFNTTRGGKLEVFPRLALEEVFGC